MAEADIPVDLFNPGQVFACLGFLEAADVILGDAEGGFDWRDGAGARFKLRANGDKSPFGVVLAFLAEADLRRCAPRGYAEPSPKKGAKKKEGKQVDQEHAKVGALEAIEFSDIFPAPRGDQMALPIRLIGPVDGGRRSIDVSHWADDSSRKSFKLYAGNRSGARIARAMMLGDGKSEGIRTLWTSSPENLEQRPFDVLGAMGGSFNFDPRGRWTAIDAGYSPDAQDHVVAASPVVELLAAIGLEHARPKEDRRAVRYAVWSGLVPPLLARAVLAGSDVGVPIRAFVFRFGGTEYNRIITFAEEIST